MTSCCVKHNATSVNGIWEFHEKQLYELNIVGPVCIIRCPKCVEEKKREYDFLRRVLPGGGV
jgi:hypothetical protein